MNKRGLSTVITNILIILLILVAIGIIWGVVGGVLRNTSDYIDTTRHTLDISIERANLSSDGIASVKVFRNSGQGDFVGISFVFEDDNTGEVFEKRFVNFNELESNTFNIDVTTGDLFLNGIYKVSIAPIIKLESGKEVVGMIADSYEGIQIGSGGGISNGTSECVVSEDCGVDTWFGDYFCDGTNLLRYKTIHECLLGICVEYDDLLTYEECSEGYCNVTTDICEAEPSSCTPETVEIDCGVDQLLGTGSCANETSVVEDFQDWSCIDNECVSDIFVVVVEECFAPDTCHDGECFEYIECENNQDCFNLYGPGNVCVEGTCEAESQVITGGVVGNVFPPGVGEFFDSLDLPSPSIENLVGYYIYFTTGQHQGVCMQIDEHNQAVPESTPYIRLDVSETNITSGDLFDIWETNYGCSFA
ncbi:MAG: hypothetical protein KC516_03350 [Nanoarchaeota archaeon]|nr:hypothetical protein [Nanoarchaeota archaeon]